MVMTASDRCTASSVSRLWGGARAGEVDADLGHGALLARSFATLSDPVRLRQLSYVVAAQGEESAHAISSRSPGEPNRPSAIT